MAEGSPHIRALYYWPSPGKRDRKDKSNFDTYGFRVAKRVLSLVAEAKSLVTGGFERPVPPGVNLSPVLQVMRAFFYLTENRTQLEQQRALADIPHDLKSNGMHIAGCLVNAFPHEMILMKAKKYEPTKQCAPNPCLIHKLMLDFGRPCPDCLWLPDEHHFFR